jgi:hypothetical protein
MIHFVPGFDKRNIIKTDLSSKPLPDVTKNIYENPN